MKVILKQDIKGVGKKDQVINASDGYARNFLFPKKLAVPADNGNIGELNAKNNAKEFKKGQEKEEAIKIKEKLENIRLKIEVKAGESGKIFGGVSSKEISEVLDKEHKILVDKKKIDLKEPIKTIGSKDVDIKLFEGVIGTVAVDVISK